MTNKAFKKKMGILKAKHTKIKYKYEKKMHEELSIVLDEMSKLKKTHGHRGGYTSYAWNGSKLKTRVCSVCGDHYVKKVQ